MKVSIKPSPKQVEGARFLLSRTRGFICYGTGTGKTMIQVLVAFRLLHDKKVDKFLFVATKSSSIEILNDFIKFTDVRPTEITSLDELERFMRSSHEQIGIFQYNWLDKFVAEKSPKILPEMGGPDWAEKTTSRAISRPYLKRMYDLLRIGRVGVSLDEFHSIKTQGGFYRAVFSSLRSTFKYCYGAAATAVSSKIYDLYSLCNFLDPKCLGSIEEFNAYYVVRRKRKVARGRQVWEVVSLKNLDVLNVRLADVMLTYFPEKEVIFETEEAPLSDEKRYFDAAAGVFEKDVDTGQDKQHSARLNDLQYVVNEDPNKLALLRKVATERSPEGFLIYCAFYKSVDLVKAQFEALGIKYMVISGAESTDERIVAKDWFNSNPRNKALILTRAGGQSLNLQSVNNMVFFDIPFGIGYFIQAMGRVVREFSKHDSYTITFLILKDTIDEYKYKLLSANRELFDRVFKNHMVPADEQFTSFNAMVIAQLRTDLLWRTKKVKVMAVPKFRLKE